jgi:hypothetical protein
MEQFTKFNELELSRSECLGVLESDIKVYNEEVELINAIVDEVTAETVKKELKEASDISIVWKDYLNYISPESITVMKAIFKADSKSNTCH